MNIFEFEDYRKFVLTTLESRQRGGRGELSKIATLLGVNSSFLSQVLHGPKNLSQEQGFLLADYFGLDELETRYLGEMINLDRASKPPFRAFIKKNLEKLRNEARWRKGVPPVDQPLDEKSQAIFYSTWQYSAIQLTTGIPGFQTVEAIANRLQVDASTARKFLSFLVECGLCVTDGERYGIGARRTHLADHSRFRGRHHLNWRLKAADELSKLKTGDVFFTGPMRIDEASFEKISELLRNSISEINQQIDKAKDETLACLNIDFFKF